MHNPLSSRSARASSGVRVKPSARRTPRSVAEATVSNAAPLAAAPTPMGRAPRHTPQVRRDEVERAGSLAVDAHYPPPPVIEKLSWFFAEQFLAANRRN